MPCVPFNKQDRAHKVLHKDLNFTEHQLKKRIFWPKEFRPIVSKLLVTTSKALVTSSDALVTTSFLLLCVKAAASSDLHVRTGNEGFSQLHTSIQPRTYCWKART